MLQAEDTAQPDAPPVSAPAENVCHRCEAPLPPGSAVCTECGRKQFRLCFCGAAVPAAAETCPICGTEWSEKIKVRRRSRSSKIKTLPLAQSALLGALITIVVAALLNLIIRALAESSAHGNLPDSILERLYYAGLTLGRAVSLLYDRLWGGFLISVVAALVGAAIGTLAYLRRTGFMHFQFKLHGHSFRRRRRKS